jgi:cell division protein FtsB
MRPWLIRFTGAAMLVALLGYVPSFIYRSDGYVHYRKLEDELDALARRNDALRAENAALRRDVHRLRTDPEAITSVARDELGMVKPGEIVIQIERP